MKCQRCFKVQDIQYRVYTEVIDLKVCSSCAAEARELGIAIEALTGNSSPDGASD